MGDTGVLVLLVSIPKRYCPPTRKMYVTHLVCVACWSWVRSDGSSDSVALFPVNSSTLTRSGPAWDGYESITCWVRDPRFSNEGKVRNTVFCLPKTSNCLKRSVLYNWFQVLGFMYLSSKFPKRQRFGFWVFGCTRPVFQWTKISKSEWRKYKRSYPPILYLKSSEYALYIVSVHS